MQKRILVSGGAGFIGSHVAEYFVKQDDVEKVFIIDNLSRAKLLKKPIKHINFNWNYLSQFTKISLHEKDIRDLNFLKRFIKEKEINIIVHTAGQTAVTTSIINPLDDFENNVIGAFNMLEAARISEFNPIMILCSTNKVFGNNVNNCGFDEKEFRYSFSSDFENGISEDFSIDLCEHTPYGASKLCSDLYFQEYGHLYGLRTAVFRMSCIYGTRQFGVEDQGWVAHFIISALKNEKIKIYGDGKQLRDLLYITDLVQAYNSYIKDADKIKHNVFCMGGGKDNTLSLLELINILEIEFDKKINYELFDWRPSDQKVYISDISKALKTLNWKPKIKPREGVQKLVKWVLENKSLF